MNIRHSAIRLLERGWNRGLSIEISFEFDAAPSDPGDRLRSGAELDLERGSARQVVNSRVTRGLGRNPH